MDQETFKQINQIISRDNKSSTYKFALLRGTIDLINDNSPFITIKGSRVHFPLGLLVEKWLLYYYPLVDVPQINRSTKLAFSDELKALVSYYEFRGGFSAFYNDLKSKGIPQDIQPMFLALLRVLASTITKMPMRYIGSSIFGRHFGLYLYESGRFKKSDTIDIEYLIKSFGTFSIPLEYYQAFQVLGSFISGQDAILFKWATFSVQASGQTFSVMQVLNDLLVSPVTERDVLESKALYKSILQKEGKVRCVWSGENLNRYDIDHIIPFSIWKNNDLWNLLPTHPKLNNGKRDKIPSLSLIDNQRELITHYWDIIHQHNTKRFRKEIQASLLGYEKTEDWHDPAINQLKLSCDNLISNRGYEAWNY
jgi:hypothetical protein